MNIKIELSGYNGFGWKVCDNCPLLGDDEWGYACALDYHASMDNLQHGWLNTVRGVFIEPNPILKTNYTHVEGIERVIIRPQECIDKHGR